MTQNRSEQIYREIITGLKLLPPDKLINVRDFVKFLQAKTNRGRFSRFAGGLSDEEADVMIEVIEEDCERIDTE